MRSWSKLMNLSRMRTPPGKISSPDRRLAGAPDCWAQRLTRPVAVMTLMIAVAANLNSVHRQSEENSAELWLGGDVNLGNGGRGQLNGISGIVQGAAGIVNLEGPVAEQRQLKTRGLRLWNSPSALTEISALNVKVAGVANNHSGDAGPLGAKHTANEL